MKNKVHLTKEGIAKINSIKLGMNTGRDYKGISNTLIDNLSSHSDIADTQEISSSDELIITKSKKIVADNIATK